MLAQPEIEQIELTRRLEAAGHVFPVDVAAVEEGLRHESLSVQEKYLHRAERLDGDGQIAAMVTRIRTGARWLPRLIGVVAFLAGYLAVTALAGSESLNVFYVLLGFLGLNTVMFLLWLLGLLLAQGQLNHSWVEGVLPWLARTPLRRAWLDMWRERVGRHGIKLFAGVLSHRWWLMFLIGMTAGFVWLLLVREYTFHWESTLLSQGHFEKIIALLAYLPSKLGFAVPDAEALAGSRHMGSLDWSRAWAGFLIGCVVVYGMLPRAVAWLGCALGLRRSMHMNLDENLPYYRRLQRLWTQRIVDADSQQAPTEAYSTAVPVRVSAAEKIACTLEVAADHTHWANNVLGRHWPDWGVVADEQDIAALSALLQQKPLQLLVGIRASALPERGLLRQLRQLRAAAQDGVLVMLLPEKARTTSAQRVGQWQQALQQEQIALINPNLAGEVHESA